ncbi:glycosyltransferase [Tepidamorphus sp. 3E244]|uniref:glycosyltransferase n=1 Tax=Tepidamorphus sp. 3E244 TaxID=3385498 RepID=UPI0038FCEFC5
MREAQAAADFRLDRAGLADARLHPRMAPDTHLSAARMGTHAVLDSGEGRGLSAVLAVSAERLERRPGLREKLLSMPQWRGRVVASSADEIAALYMRDPHAGIVPRAVSTLADRFPSMSARRTLSGLQALWMVLLACLIAYGAYAAPDTTGRWAVLALSLVFLSATALRLVAMLLPIPASHPWLDLTDAQLPVYTVLVPLYREAAMVPGLVGALNALDYPREKLDIKMLLEEDDLETRIAVDAADLPPEYEILAVPPEGPRTKPKALSVGLALARGTLVCVFDAEDQPDPDQLRQAAGAFALAGPHLACLQARLAYRNWNQSLLTRQFAIEYAAQFDVMAPFICWSGLPLPLGGTSNHFRGIR